MLYKTLNNEQREIFDRLVSGENLFITGNAGTGKSYLVKAFDEWCEKTKRNLVKTAPTGVAALEIGGATLHRQFGLEVGLDFTEVTEESVVTNKKLNFLKRADVLLIDEISMVRMDVFDRLMLILEAYNKYRKSKRKNPVQLVFVGDFFQLAPVINREERPYLEEYYHRPIGDAYCFQSRYWKLFKVQLCNLTKVVRQADPQFCQALDECKEGDIHCLQFIRQTSASDIIPNAIWLCGKNATAATKNMTELMKIKEPSHTYVAKYSGDVTTKDKLCEETLTLKVGARVVFLINDQLDRFQNGTTGTVTTCENDAVTVKVDDRKDFSGVVVEGKTVRVEIHAFCKYKYESKAKTVSVVDENSSKKQKREFALAKVETGRAEQLPLRLGYAVTVHKSQGQTYDAMNVIPEIFATGQLYVALSRCKTIQNMHIEGNLTNRMVMSSAEVLAFYSDPESYSFFGDGIATLHVPEKYKDKILALIKEWESGVESESAQQKTTAALNWGRRQLSEVS